MKSRLSIFSFFLFSLVLLASLTSASGFGYDTDTSTVIAGGDTLVFNFTINGTEAIHNNLTGLQGGNGTEYFHLNQTIWTYLMENIYSFGSLAEVLWSANYSLYNDSWSSITNTSYALASEPHWSANYSLYNDSWSSGINWTEAVNGTLLSQADWDTNYTTNNIPWLNTTNHSYVPYIGATGDVSLGAYNLTAANLTATDDIYLADDLIHFGDPDTYFSFGPNMFIFTAGGNTAMGLTSTAVTFGLDILAPSINATFQNITGDYFCNSTSCYTVTEFLESGVGDVIWTNNTETVYINTDYPQNLNITGNLTVTVGPSTFAGDVEEGTALGYDNVRIGEELGTPRILFENAGDDIWGVDVYDDYFRFYTTYGAGFPVLALNSTSIITNEVFFVDNNTYVTENVSATHFVGDGSFLTGLSSGITWTEAINGTLLSQADWDTNYTTNNEPWLNTTNHSYVPYAGATVDVDLGIYNITTTGQGFFNDVTIANNLTVRNGSLFDGDLMPNVTLSYDIGSGPNRWALLYVQNVSSDYIINAYDIGTARIFFREWKSTNGYNISRNRSILEWKLYKLFYNLWICS